MELDKPTGDGSMKTWYAVLTPIDAPGTSPKIVLVTAESVDVAIAVVRQWNYLEVQPEDLLMYCNTRSNDYDAEAAGCFAICGIVLCLLLIGVCLGVALGRFVERSERHTEAVKRGKGEWVTDTQGWTTFKWKEEAVTNE